jgi:type IV pilus assembly protein PilM
LFGFGKRKGPSFGLDINSDSITLIQLEKTRAGIELNRFACQPTPPNAVREGLIAEPVLVGQVVLELLTQAGWSPAGPTPTVHIAVPAQSSVIRLMPVPTGMPPEELADVVTQEAMNHVPFPIADANLDWSLMPATERTDQDGVRRVDVILAAIQRSIIESYWRMCDCAGIKLGRVDISSLAVIRALALAGYLGSSGHLSMIVNIRHDATDINVVRSAMPLFGRSIMLGVETLTEAISSSLNISFDQALEMLPEIRLFGNNMTVTTDVQLGQAGQIARTVFGDITDELQRSLEFYKSQVGEVRVDQIILTGPGCMIPQLDDLIKNKLNLKTIVADPMRDLNLEKQPISERLRPILAALIGTSIDTNWSPSFTVDLDLNKEGRLPLFEATATQKIVRPQPPTAWFRPALLTGLALLLLTVMLGAYFGLYDLPAKRKEAQALKDKIVKEQQELRELGKVRAENKVLSAKKLVLDKIIKRSFRCSSVLKDIRDNTPMGVQMTSIIFENKAIKLVGVARDFSSVSQIAVSLKKAASVREAVVETAERRDKSPDLIDFTVSVEPDSGQLNLEDATTAINTTLPSGKATVVAADQSNSR